MKKNIVVFAILLAVVLPAVRAQQTWLLDHDFKNRPCGFVMGYCNQQIEGVFGSQHFYGSGIWEDGVNKRLHGGYFGFMLQNNIVRGFGLYSGFMMEVYVSTNDPSAVDYAYSADEAFDMYYEVALNVPLHAQFMLPLSDVFAIGVHSGLGFTCSVGGGYSDSRGYFDDSDPFDSDGNMKRFNITFDLGLALQLHSVRLDLLWQSGLRDYKMFSGVDDETATTYRNRFSVGMTFLLGA